MNKKHTILISILFVFAFSMRCFCSPAEDYTRSVLKGISNDIKKSNKNSVIFSWERDKNEKVIVKENESKKENDFPPLIGFSYVNIVKCPKLNIYYLNDNYVLKRDDEGHSAIAYHDLDNNEPKIAYDGFYVIDKMDELTKEMKKCRYYVDKTGYILSGWIEEDDGTRYYMSEKSETYGEAVVGNVVFSDGKTYSFDENGKLVGAW